MFGLALQLSPRAALNRPTPHASSFHLQPPVYQLPSPSTPGKPQAHFYVHEATWNSCLPPDRISTRQQKSTYQQCTPPLDTQGLVSEPPSSHISRNSSQSSIFSQANFSGRPYGFTDELQYPTYRCPQLPSVRDFMAGAGLNPQRDMIDATMRCIQDWPLSQETSKSYYTSQTHLTHPSTEKGTVQASAPLLPPNSMILNEDDIHSQPLQYTTTESSPPCTLIRPRDILIETDPHALSEIIDHGHEQADDTLKRKSEPEPLVKPLKRAKKTVSYKFDEDANALFFSNTKIDYKFIVRHLARESQEHKFEIDYSQPSQSIEITDNDLIRWCVLEFLYNDIKLYDRRYDTSQLIHDIPQNRFDVTIEFVLCRKGVKKTVNVSMTLLKPSSSKLKNDTISKDLSRILAEVFLNHKKDTLGKKRRWSSSRPQWGLGADDELSIVDLNIAIS